MSPDNNFTYFVGITFDNASRSYFFGYDDKSLKNGDKVVVETIRGIELGTVTIAPIEIAKLKSELELKPIIRKATESDIKIDNLNKRDAVDALKICEVESKNLNLDMRLISCEYTLDKAKVIFSYLADDRVDFRELLKVLAHKLHTRIELRQIGTRDKAKSIGGLGVCGRELCCSSFLNEFDGISINRAKNQMLAINVPKLSGHCGKLMCCLKYEDDIYTDCKTNFPEIGRTFFIDKVEYKVTGINVISETIKLENQDNIINLTLEDFTRQTHFREKERHQDRHHNRDHKRHEKR
ncbi:MAG: stage 0 sporulation protein [Bacilli bacterium]|nr:stage 0 sporulation protein [Bacilli bacterium]MBO4682713.1 stage 0 sporulation protein [Bacilli bacterium]